MLSNFDKSTSVVIAPAYIDSLIGQSLVTVDYEIKALWHGAHFDNKDSRAKFNDKWRYLVGLTAAGVPAEKKNFVRIFTTPSEATGTAVKDISKKPSYVGIYDNPPLTTEDDMKVFMNNIDNFSMYATMNVNQMSQHKNMIIAESSYRINGLVDEPDLTLETYDQIQFRIRAQADVIQEALNKNPDIRKCLLILKIVASFIPIFAALKKRGKIINLDRLLEVTMAGSSDEMRTEKELPPHILGKKFKCTHFENDGRYFSLHGRLGFDPETADITEVPSDVRVNYEEIMKTAKNNLDEMLASTSKYADAYPVPVFKVGRKEFHLIYLEIEQFNPKTEATPGKPLWVDIFFTAQGKLLEKGAGIKDDEVKEFFKRKYGFKKAMNLLIPFNGVRVAAELGLLSVTQAFVEKGGASLITKQDSKGLSLTHSAAIKNQVNIVMYLLNKGAPIDERRYSQSFSGKNGPSPLHLACKHGSIDVVDCLIACKAKLNIRDSNGWITIHGAAYYDHASIVEKLIRRDKTLVNITTYNKKRETPLHMAASSGALKATKCLIQFNADRSIKNSEGDNVIHLAALNFHNNIIEYYIQEDFEELAVWDLLVAMLYDEETSRKCGALKSLEYLSTATDYYWQYMLNSKAIPALVEQLLNLSEDIQALTCSIINNISTHTETRVELTKTKAIPILIGLLGSPEPDIQSRAAVILTDMADLSVDVGNDMREKGAIEKCFSVLDEGTIEDVLINIVLFMVPLSKSPENQELIMELGIDELVMEFLSTSSDDLKAATARCISAVAQNHVENQKQFVYTGVLPPLIELMKTRNLQVQITGALALESLATNNPETQAIILQHEAHVPLIKLLKIWDMGVKEQSSYALWALAGQALMQQKTISNSIGIPQCIDMILLSSDKLQYVGCLCIGAMAKQDVTIQQKLVEQSAIPPLVRLLHEKTEINEHRKIVPVEISVKVQIACIKAIGIICVGVAHRSNSLTQEKLNDEKAIEHVLKRLIEPKYDENMQVEAAYTLSNLVLNNSKNFEVLASYKTFHYKRLLNLLNHSDEKIALKAGMTLTTFAFNNVKQQYAIKDAGGVSMRQFSRYLKSENEVYQAHGAFMCIVLAKLIIDMDQVSLTSRCVNLLARLLASPKDESKIKSASFIASLVHTRPGIPEVFVTMGCVEQAVKNIQSSRNVEVQRASAAALGYLTFNAFAARILLATCRARPQLYDQLMENLEADAKINESFIEKFKVEMEAGCPMHHLEVMGGPPVKEKTDYSETGSYRSKSRATTASSMRSSRPTTSSSWSGGRKSTSATTSRPSYSAKGPRTQIRTSTRESERPLTSNMRRPTTTGSTKSVKIVETL